MAQEETWKERVNDEILIYGSHLEIEKIGRTNSPPN